MAGFVSWLNAEQEVHPILVSGVARFQLVHIHPFLDRNGRTARLLSMLCLYRKGYDFKRLFTFSEYYDRDRSSYYRAIQSVRERELDLAEWLEYFTIGLSSQLAEVQAKGESLIRLDVLTSHRDRAPRHRDLVSGRDLDPEAVALESEATDMLKQIVDNLRFTVDKAVRLSEWSRAREALQQIMARIEDREDDRYRDAERRLIIVQQHLRR